MFDAGKGDSGSPILENIHDGEFSYEVTFDGVLNSGVDRHGNIYYYYYYSSVTRIKNELEDSNIRNLSFY
jgi:hypothetical protein